MSERSYAMLRASVLGDPAVRDWVKSALATAERRDPLDALADAELLVRLLKVRLNEALGQGVSDDG